MKLITQQISYMGGYFLKLNESLALEKIDNKITKPGQAAV